MHINNLDKTLGKIYYYYNKYDEINTTKYKYTEEEFKELGGYTINESYKKKLFTVKKKAKKTDNVKDIKIYLQVYYKDKEEAKKVYNNIRWDKDKIYYE